MTIGIAKLRAAADLMKEAIPLVNLELKNPELREEVRKEVREIIEDLESNVSLEGMMGKPEAAEEDVEPDPEPEAAKEAVEPDPEPEAAKEAVEQEQPAGS